MNRRDFFVSSGTLALVSLADVRVAFAKNQSVHDNTLTLRNVHMSSGSEPVEILVPPDAKGRYSIRGGNVCQKYSLGWATINRESKLEWGPITNPGPTARCRDHNAHAYAIVCGPDSILNDILNDVRTCCMQGLAAAGLATIISSPVAAQPVFWAAFKLCMEQKIGAEVNKVSVQLEVEDETTEWGPC